MKILYLFYFNIASLLILFISLMTKKYINIALSFQIFLIVLIVCIYLFSKNERQSMHETLAIRKFFKKDKNSFKNEDEYSKYNSFLSLLELRIKDNELTFSININNIESKKNYERIENDIYEYLIDKFSDYQFTKQKNIIKGIKK